MCRMCYRILSLSLAVSMSPVVRWASHSFMVFPPGVCDTYWIKHYGILECLGDATRWLSSISHPFFY